MKNNLRVKLQNFTMNIILSFKSKSIHSGNLLEAVEEILCNRAQYMNISRISIWEIDEQNQSLILVVAYDSLKNEFSYSGKLHTKDYPNYFKNLFEEKIIVANDVFNDLKTSEFLVSYTRPIVIKSMMDADEKFKGILCCEEQRQYRNWDDINQLFSISVSKLISISYYYFMRKEQYENLENIS